MKPYYQADGITIYHGDGAEVAQGHNGVVVSDPPYNIGYHYNSPSDRREEGVYNRLLLDAFRTPSVIVAYPEVVFRLSLLMGVTPDSTAAWVYPANTPRQMRLVGWFGRPGHPERVSQPYRNPTDKRVAALMADGREARGYDWREIPQVKNVSKDKTGHPCQNPVAVMDWILRATDFDGLPVIDPFMGSGTTLVADMALGIPAIGSDIEERYCEIAAKRLSQGRLSLK